MAGLGEAILSVGADVSGFEDDLANALENALGKNKFAGLMVTSAAAGVAAVIKEFIPLEKAILQIFQVEGVSATEDLFNALSNQILDVAAKVGKPAEEVGASIALGIGRGFSEQESIDLTETASNLAVALGEDLDPAMKGITASLNGFNLGLKDTDRVAGVLFQTVAKTGVPMSQLAQQLGNLAPAARNAGISIEDAAASIATAVQQGLTAAEATTQFRTAITELSREGSDGGKVFEHIAGATFPEFIKQGHTLNDALRLIQVTQDKTGFSIQELTGNYNTANATVVSTGKGVELYTKNLADNKKGIEGMSAALDSANQGVFRQFQVALNNIRVGVQRIGIAFRPLITAITAELVPVFTTIGEKLNEFARRVDDVDFTPVVDAVHFVVEQFKSVGPLITAIFNLFAGLNWQQIGDAIKMALAPVAIALMTLRVGIEAITEVIQFVTPAIQALLDVISFLAVPVAAVVGLFAGFGTILLGVVAGLAILGKTIMIVRTAIVALRLAAMLLWTAFGPVGTIVIAIGLLTAAFIYAWKESETFRNVVVTTLNTIKDAVATGVNFIVHVIAGWVDFQLAAIEKILRAAGKLPKWAGGGAFDSAADAVAGIRSGIQSMVDKVDQLTAAVKNADLALTSMFQKAERLNEQAAQEGLWFGNEATDKALREALKGPGGGGGGGPSSIPTPNTKGLDELLNPAKTKKAAKDIAKQMRDLLGDLFKDVQKFARDIGEATVDSIESGFDGIIDKFNNAIETAAEAGQKKVVAQLKTGLKAFKSFEKQLVKLANKRDLVSDNLKDAQQALKDLRTESDRFEAGVKAAFVNLGSVAEASQGIGVTFRGLRNNLKAALRDTQLFNKAITELQALNLNEASLRQLADAGPAALAQARALARSGAGGVAEINKLQALLEKEAGKTADRLADDFYNAGIASAKGLVAGLQKELPKIIAQMEKVADAMVAAVKKKLKIKSPSQVFADEVGAQIPAGAAVGVRRGIPELVKAVEAMTAASTVSFGNGSVQVNGVSDPAAARRAGILAGEAIAQTLQKRATAQTLAGVR